MSNYYELLKIQPSATFAEIEAAYDECYNQWRRLVTHHDPVVVEEANRSLRTLEQIRATLIDPAKRAAYDAGIGIGGPTEEGLANPEAVLRRAQMAPPIAGMAQPTPPVPQASPRVDAWICQKCHTPNAVGLQFCAKCGQTIGRECPKCKKMIAVIAEFCPYCGINVAAELDSIRRQQIDLRRKQIEAARADIAKSENDLNRVIVLKSGYQMGCGMQLLSWGICLWPAALWAIPNLGKSSAQLGGEKAALITLGVLLAIGMLLATVMSNARHRSYLAKSARQSIERNRNHIAQLEDEIRQIQAGAVFP